MKLLNRIFGNREEEVLDVIIDDVPEVAKEQWSALYITGLDTDCSHLQEILSHDMIFKNGVFENILADGNKISVLNAIKPGSFSADKVSGVVVLVNANSFSEYADILLKEMYNISCKIVRLFPEAILGAKPNQGFSSEEFTHWLKKEREKYFFIE